jgi:hypothetical protein
LWVIFASLDLDPHTDLGTTLNPDPDLQNDHKILPWGRFPLAETVKGWRQYAAEGTSLPAETGVRDDLCEKSLKDKFSGSVWFTSVDPDTVGSETFCRIWIREKSFQIREAQIRNKTTLNYKILSVCSKKTLYVVIISGKNKVRVCRAILPRRKLILR